MFTLKLMRRKKGETSAGRLETKIFAVDHVCVFEIAEKTIELRACPTAQDGIYESFFIGERTKEMTAITDDNHWEWGLLENWEGNTSQHFRPYTYG